MSGQAVEVPAEFTAWERVPVSDRRYEIRTWDTEADKFTPQDGVPVGPYTLFGLRAAIRQLRLMGYEGYRTDCSTLVERVA